MTRKKPPQEKYLQRLKNQGIFIKDYAMVIYFFSSVFVLSSFGTNRVRIPFWEMAGLLVPAKATELVQALKDSTSLPVELHTHYPNSSIVS